MADSLHLRHAAPGDELRAIAEHLRCPSPAPAPQGLAFDGETLWIASCKTHRLYALDPTTWTVLSQWIAPGEPFGITADRGELRVIIGFGEDADDRYVYRFSAAHGFANAPLKCPDLTGAYLAMIGGMLYLAQAHDRRIVVLDHAGAVVQTIPIARRPVGLTSVGADVYLITTDDAFKNSELATIDVRAATPRLAPLASIPFAARGLAFHDARFWTSLRDRGEIVAFTCPT